MIDLVSHSTKLLARPSQWIFYVGIQYMSLQQFFSPVLFHVYSVINVFLLSNLILKHFIFV